VSAHVVRTRPVVVVRDEVATIARVEGLEIRSRAVATQSGELGDVIWVVNPDSRKRLRARVVGPGLVEVGHGS
jgi:flagella basal body P-ring formation protein FlgA